MSDSNTKKDYKTYIILCENDDLYCGKTDNIERRMKEHLNEKIPSFFGFKGRKPFYLSIIVDGDYEKKIKRAGVKFIYNLIGDSYGYERGLKKYEVYAS